MRRSIFTLAFAATALVALPAAAQGPGQGWGPSGGPCWGDCVGYRQGGGMMYGPGHMMGWGRSGVPGRGRFTAIDANEDGAVSSEEAAFAAEQVFAAMDANADEALTKDEYMAVRMGPRTGWNEARQAERQETKAARFDEMDADGDGQVSRAEFMEGGKAHFEAADSDKDGTVTPWEFRRRAWN